MTTDVVWMSEDEVEASRARLEDEIIARYPGESIKDIAASLGINAKQAYRLSSYLRRQGRLRVETPRERAIRYAKRKAPIEQARSRRERRRDVRGRFLPDEPDMRKLRRRGP
jgi:transposase-like protein